ncbi:MAG TPA: DNA polymerase Y family protein [Gemmatimonadales bacterium]
MSGRAMRPNNPLTSERAVCLWIATFPLRCERFRRPELERRPVVLVSPTDLRRVWQVGDVARRAGVSAGMTVSQAIGLCPALAVLEPDPVYYDEQFTHLLDALETVSPVVEPVELGRAYVGVDGVERLYGDPSGQLTAVANAVARRPALGHANWHAVARLGWGRGKFTAWVAATRARPGSPMIIPDDGFRAFLATQPVAVLPVGVETHRRLRRLGLTTLAHVARLPEVALVSQFGKEGQTAWRFANGLQHDPVVGHRRPEPIVLTLQLPVPVADRAMLLHAWRMLTARALQHPRRSGWRVRALRARAILEHGASWLTEITLKDPTAVAEHIVDPLAAKLDQSPPTGAATQLVVEFTTFTPGTQELHLFAQHAASAARAGRQRALRTAAQEIRTRFRRPLLHHVIEIQPWSRIPERRYALIDYEP